MKASLTMQQVVEQLVERHGVDLAQVGVFLRLDLPGQDSLVIDHIGTAQVAVTSCFEECGEWQIDREVVFFTGDTKQWIPLEITQHATGWKAFAKLDAHGQRILRIHHCDQERLADFAERWARTLIRQHWLEQGIPYVTWTPPSLKGAGMSTQAKPQRPLFALGQVVATPGALEALAEANQSPWALLNRHQSGDWGDVPPEDKQENDFSVTHELRILSAYRLSTGVKLWLITEADRSSSTLLLPSEY